MSKKTFRCLRIVLNHLRVTYWYNCTKMLQMYLSQPLWKFITFWCWHSICITIGQIIRNFHYNPLNISRVIKKSFFFAFFKCRQTMHWILNISLEDKSVLAYSKKAFLLPLVWPEKNICGHSIERRAYRFVLKTIRVLPIPTLPE